MKDEIITAFGKYLRNNGFRQVKRLAENRSDTSSDILVGEEINFEPDITAENEGVRYYYKYLEGRQDASDLVKDFKSFIRNKNQKQVLKLLVPLKQSDGVIQFLNAHQLEGVGIIRVSPRKATAQ